MEGKKYSHVRENDIGMVSEPAGEYAAAAVSGHARMSVGVPESTFEKWDPGIGPYSMKELDERICEADAAISRFENGDKSDWLTEEQAHAKLYTKYPWLR